MKLEQIDLEETGCFSALFIDYIQQKTELQPFYNLFPTVENFAQIISKRSFAIEKREVLRNEILKQYNHSCSSLQVKENIDALALENTFTITTGHQLNIFTGPLYFIYKILSVVNICKELKERHPSYNFIPVYWMASEDHDFEEINHFHLFGKKYEWRKDAKGAVGRMDPSDIIHSLGETGVIPEKFKEIYSKEKTLSDATREIVNYLFGKYGVVVLDPDARSLKSLFKEILLQEVTERKSCELVLKTTKTISDLGYKTQVTPREINLFYLEDGIRERIEFDGYKYTVLNSPFSFSQEELVTRINKSPENFSPNVVLRPVYQEVILPNLAYIGGPAEVAYWLQLKDAFSFYQIPFPLLMPRNFLLFINRLHLKKLDKLNIPVKDFFLEENKLKTKFIEDHSEHTFHLNEEVEELGKVFEKIKVKAVGIDKSLKDYVGAEFHKVKTLVEGMEKKLKKAEEKNQEIAINQLLTLKGKLFPNGELQERHDNFLNFYITDADFIDKVAAFLNPFHYKFNVLIDNEES